MAGAFLILLGEIGSILNLGRICTTELYGQTASTGMQDVQVIEVVLSDVTYFNSKYTFVKECNLRKRYETLFCPLVPPSLSEQKSK